MRKAQKWNCNWLPSNRVAKATGSKIIVLDLILVANIPGTQANFLGFRAGVSGYLWYFVYVQVVNISLAALTNCCSGSPHLLILNPHSALTTASLAYQNLSRTNIKQTPLHLIILTAASVKDPRPRERKLPNIYSTPMMHRPHLAMPWNQTCPHHWPWDMVLTKNPILWHGSDFGKHAAWMFWGAARSPWTWDPLAGMALRQARTAAQAALEVCISAQRCHTKVRKQLIILTVARAFPGQGRHPVKSQWCR